MGPHRKVQTFEKSHRVKITIDSAIHKRGSINGAYGASHLECVTLSKTTDQTHLMGIVPAILVRQRPYQ